MQRNLPHVEEIDARLHKGQQDLAGYLNALCDRIEAVEPRLQALLPEPDRRARLLKEAGELQARFPDPSRRPALFGTPIGVKDIFRVDGFLTRAGSRLPTELFAGPEASCVGALRRAGALVLGKTVTTEFACFAPGPTRNPRRLTHTPGGSSSGSAAAVAAGYCPLALGSQTIGSVIRPAAYCGITGFKPTCGRIPIDGVIPVAPSLDHVGFFTPDAGSLARVAAVLCSGWRSAPGIEFEEPPAVGVPEGPYLSQASPEALSAFEQQVARLEAAGCRVRRVPASQVGSPRRRRRCAEEGVPPLGEIEAINRRHKRLMVAEMSQVHAAWFAEHESLYHPRTADLIREGQSVSAAEAAEARAGQSALRQELQGLMTDHGILAWISPAATGPAPEGLDSTGDPIMNLPWTHAGLPVVTIPAGAAANGLPLGLQIAAAAGEDEWLVAFAAWLEPRWHPDAPVP
jgi:Asp-tRNA(Asn)/Glu-tRNA(Gln) amidotransferase A subunit family amidase